MDNEEKKRDGCGSRTPTALLARYDRLKSDRDGRWLPVFREVRRYCMPTYSDFLTEGGQRGTFIYDTTAIEARARLAAGMYAWMAPPNERWFELIPDDDELAADEDVKDYFAEVTRRVAFALANSNWTSVLIEALNNLACGLDAVVYVEDGAPYSLLQFRSFPVETVCYCENSRCTVDTVFREFTLTNRQIVQEFGRDRLPEQILSAAADPKKLDEKRAILHAVFPRNDRDPACIDNKNMPFADYYIDLQTKSVIQEGGFEEFPFAVCRFEKSDNESYGRGPGLNLLPTIKMVNRMRAAYLLAREHQSDPSWLAPDGSIVSGQFNRDPGSFNFYRPDIAGAGKPEPVQNVARLESLYQDILQEDQTIKDGFFWDIFDPLGDLKSMTATEAEIRNEGKTVPFAPIAGNLHNELFRVVIHRVYGILLRLGALPDLPPQLVGGNAEYKVEFVSKIARSLSNRETLSWIQTEASLANLLQMKPEIMDNFDLDAIARGIAAARGVDPKMLVPVRDRDKARSDRAQAQQQSAAAEQMLAGAGALGNNLAKAPEPGSPLAAVLQGHGV